MGPCAKTAHQVDLELATAAIIEKRRVVREKRGVQARERHFRKKMGRVVVTKRQERVEWRRRRRRRRRRRMKRRRKRKTEDSPFAASVVIRVIRLNGEG